jgi:hypothetical protein
MENLKEELDFINKLKEAMEIGLKREVFMPEILKVKYYINHQSQFLELNKSDVISSVCNHRFVRTTKNYKPAKKCVECGCVVQTDL